MDNYNKEIEYGRRYKEILEQTANSQVIHAKADELARFASLTRKSALTFPNITTETVEVLGELISVLDKLENAARNAEKPALAVFKENSKKQSDFLEEVSKEGIDKEVLDKVTNIISDPFPESQNLPRIRESLNPRT